jgi:hypothetical protein
MENMIGGAHGANNPLASQFIFVENAFGGSGPEGDGPSA